MSGIKNSRKQVEQLVLLALLTAVVAVLAYFGGFIKIGGFASVSLTLIPVVLGAALYGPLRRGGCDGNRCDPGAERCRPSGAGGCFCGGL